MLPDLAKHTEKLLYFYEIIHEGSMQATSRKLGVSAATLSYSIKELESATGVVLLNRTKKGITPTAPGERLYEFCRKLYQDLDQVQMQINDLNHPMKRKIRIGTFSSIAMYFWPLLLEELHKEETLTISITTKRSKEVLESLMKRDIEVAITVGSFQHANLIKHNLYQDSYSFYIKGDSPLRKISLSDLKEHVLLYIPDAEDEESRSLRYHVQHFGFKFKEEFELDSFEVIGEFVKRGYGIGILPNLVAKNLGESVKKIQVGNFQRKFGDHCFYLSCRIDSEIKERDLKMIIWAANNAVKKMHVSN